jgi:hypothetical protein
MGRLPRELEEKRQRLVRAAQRGAFEGYVRRGYVPEVYSASPRWRARRRTSATASPCRRVVGVTYGTVGSTRLDVLELVSSEMGCVYDYKTGKAGLTTAQVMKIVMAWNNRFPNVPVVILEMRQNLPVWSD